MADSPSELHMELEKLERKHAENPEGRYFVPLANAYRKLRDLDLAERLLREGLRQHPDYLSAHIVLGRTLADGGATREAAEEFRFVLSLDPQNLIALRTLGELAEADGRRDQAEEWYRELLAVDPLNDDARRALEAMDPPGGLVPSDSFEGGGSWWQRPDGEQPEGLPDEAAMPSLVEPPAAAPEPAFPPAAEDVAPPAPAPLPEYGGEWLSLDEDPAPAPEPEPAPSSSAPAPLAGAELEAEEAELPADEDGEVELVTETIAELYARQGFHDRAAHVYRELIRRRGGDPALQRRLDELEGRAPPPALGEGAGPSFGAAETPAPQPPAAELPREEPEFGVPTPWVELEPEEPEELPQAGWPAAAPDDAHLPAAGLVELDGAAEGLPADDVFADSLELGFGAAPAADAPASRSDWLDLLDAEPPAADVFAAPPAGFEPTGGEPYAEPLPELAAAAAPAPEEAAGSLSIGDYLARLAAWRPGMAPAEAPAEGATAEEPEELEPLPFPVWSPVEPPLPDPFAEELPELSAQEPAAPEPAEQGTISASDVLFPWELESPVEPPAAEAEAEELPAVDAAHGVAEEAEVGAPEPQAGTPAPPAPAEEEDDDLESFQAWLRSLKR